MQTSDQEDTTAIIFITLASCAAPEPTLRCGLAGASTG
jgi:hypothetical protein